MKLRILPLGGLENVTKNLYVYEYWDDAGIKDIILIDCGIGFLSELEVLGIDFVIPDISYLKDKIHLIRALLITHGHEDHIGAIPHVIKGLGFPKIFAPKLASLFIKEKLKEEKIQDAQVNIIEYKKTYEFGAIKARFIHMTHSIPDTTHIVVQTPVGNVYHGSDFKMDLTPVYGAPPDFAEIIRASNAGVQLMLSDGLGSEREGYTLSESIVGNTFDEEMSKTKGRFFMSTFASNISRIRQCVDAALKYNRKVCFIGSSMKRNTAIAIAEKYLRILPHQLIAEHEIARQKPNHVCIILTGSQGEFSSALEKIASKRHRIIRIQKGDRVFFSSDPIPGNEQHIQDVIESLIEQGADVIYTAIRDQLHTSGHGSQEDLKLLARLVKPKYLVPIGTTIKHSRAYQMLMMSLGYKEDNIMMLHSGEPIVMTRDRITKEERIPVKEMLVDGTLIGDVGVSILGEREQLGKEGVLVILMHGPDIRLESKGFLFNEKALFPQVKTIVAQIMKKTKDRQKLKDRIISEVSGFLNKQVQRSPVIIPVLL